MSDKALAGDSGLFDPDGLNDGRAARKGIAQLHKKSGAAPLEKPERFSERGMFEYVRSLVGAGRFEDATRYIIETVPALANSGMNAKEKFNHLLFLPRMVQLGSNLKHGPEKALRKFHAVEQQVAGLDLPPNGGFVELGCGAHDPIALSACYFLNGFAPVFAVDLLPPRNEVYSALSMYDILANAKMFPGRYSRHGVPPKDIMQQIRKFDVAAFENGDFYGGFKPLSHEIRFEAVDVVKSSIEPNSISLYTSFAVLEHVSDIEGVCEHIFTALKPGGVCFHFIDLTDHRSYRGDKAFGPFSFLTEAEAPENMNRLRAPEIRAAHEKAGFEIVKDTRSRAEISAKMRDALLPKYKAMPIEDVSVIKYQLVVRKPA